jgi:hypothetical protein
MIMKIVVNFVMVVKFFNNRKTFLFNVHLLLKCLLLIEENAQNFRKQHCCTTCVTYSTSTTVSLGLVSITVTIKIHIGNT